MPDVDDVRGDRRPARAVARPRRARGPRRACPAPATSAACRAARPTLAAAATDAGECVFVPASAARLVPTIERSGPRATRAPGDVDGVRRRAGAACTRGGALPEARWTCASGRRLAEQTRQIDGPRRQAGTGPAPGRSTSCGQPTAGDCPTACPTRRCGPSTASVVSLGTELGARQSPSSAPLTSATDERRRVLLTSLAGPADRAARPLRDVERASPPGCAPRARGRLRRPGGGSGEPARYHVQRWLPTEAQEKCSTARRPPGPPERARPVRVADPLGQRRGQVRHERLGVDGGAGAVLQLLDRDQRPVSPSSTTSGMPPVAVATTGAAGHGLEVDDAERLVDRRAGEDGAGATAAATTSSRGSISSIQTTPRASARSSVDQRLDLGHDLRGVRRAGAEHQLDVRRQLLGRRAGSRAAPSAG